MSKKINIAKQFLRATIDSQTINVEKKQFGVVFATENPVFRRGWDENYYEILVCDKASIRTNRMDADVVPLLDNHDKWSGVKGQYGRLISYEIKDKQVRGVIQFSNRSDLSEVWDDIKAGIIKGISVGYIPWVYERTESKDETVPVYRAKDWEPLEISLAPIPADFNSAVRSEESNERTYEIEIQNFKNEEMSKEVTTTPVVEQQRSQTTQAAGTTDTVVATVTTAATQATQATPVTVDLESERSNAAAAERKRINDIDHAVRAAGLQDTFRQELIDGGKSIEDCRALIINEMAKNTKSPDIQSVNTNAASASGDANQGDKRALQDALMFRAKVENGELKDKASEFRGMTMVEMARHYLRMAGDNTYYSPFETVQRAIATTDYPALLTNVVEYSLRKEYSLIQQDWKPLASETSISDFKTKTGYRFEGSTEFKKIAEGGEYEATKLFTDDKANIKLETFGRLVQITRQAIVNDELDAFKKIPSILARAAANMQLKAFWNIITGNAKTPDGTALFHTTHKNLAASGSVLSEDSLNTGIVAMSKQTSLSGELITNSPEYLLVPSEKEMLARKLMSGVTAGNTNDVNTMQGRFKLIVSPVLSVASTQSWYLVNPQTEGIIYSYLDGNDSIFTESQTNFKDDTLETKARLDFAIAVWDFKGWYKNPGA